jgi:hypothetical protein
MILYKNVFPHLGPLYQTEHRSGRSSPHSHVYKALANFYPEYFAFSCKRYMLTSADQCGLLPRQVIRAMPLSSPVHVKQNIALPSATKPFRVREDTGSPVSR